MKCLALFAAALTLCACAPAPRVPQQDLYMLTADSFETATSQGGFDESLKSLGAPTSTQVNIRACPKVAFDAIFRVKAALEQAGYTRIGFAAPDKIRCARA